ncbi:hypothetical protein ACVDFE_02015 [Lentzea chajnantorensis]
MSIPATPGHAWKSTAEGLRHQLRYDDNRYDEHGRQTARCGELVTPVLDQPACPGCLVASPAAELADGLEARSAARFSAQLEPEPEDLRRDR